MNLFVLDKNAELAAAGLDDKRLGSALMEATMMLSVAVRDWGLVGPGWLCRPSHQHHPVTLWVGRNRATFTWTWRYANYVSWEYNKRFGKIHGANERLEYICSLQHHMPDGDLYPFQNSARHAGLGLDFTHLDVPLSYRAYLQERWKTDKRPATYINRTVPDWVDN